MNTAVSTNKSRHGLWYNRGLNAKIEDLMSNEDEYIKVIYV